MVVYHKLTDDAALKVMQAAEDLKMPLGGLPVNGVFSITLMTSVASNASAPSTDELNSYRVRMTGEKIFSEVSLFRFAYLRAMAEEQLKDFSDGKYRESPLSTIEEVKGFQFPTLVKVLKPLIAKGTALTALQFTVLAQLKQINKYSTSGSETLLLDSCYKDTGDFEKNTANLTWADAKVDYPAWKKAHVELLASGLKDPSMLEKPQYWATVPVVKVEVVNTP
jgi:hypothetical protein